MHKHLVVLQQLASDLSFSRGAACSSRPHFTESRLLQNRKLGHSWFSLSRHCWIPSVNPRRDPPSNRALSSIRVACSVPCVMCTLWMWGNELSPATPSLRTCRTMPRYPRFLAHFWGQSRPPRVLYLLRHCLVSVWMYRFA